MILQLGRMFPGPLLWKARDYRAALSRERQRFTSCVRVGTIWAAPRECVSICPAEVNMADVSERTLQVAVVVSFAAGFLAGWQANRMRRKFLDWRKKRLQDKLSETQKKIDLAWAGNMTSDKSGVCLKIKCGNAVRSLGHMTRKPEEKQIHIIPKSNCQYEVEETAKINKKRGVRFSPPHCSFNIRH